jgi:hypothetical protein
MITGIVEKYYVDGPRRGKKGEFYIHSLVVDGQKYSAFGSKPAQLAKSGDKVTFEESPNGDYMNFNGSTFKVLEASTAPAATQSSGNQRDASIGRQNALRHATAMVTAFADAGIYKDPMQMALEAVMLCEKIIYPYIESGAVGTAKPKDSPETPNDELPF